jgi:hypothetical protein
MTSIEVDFDVYKVLTMKRETESVTYNDVLRKMLGLGAREPAGATTAGNGCLYKGVHFPEGTQFRTTYKGKTYTGEIKGGVWTDERGLHSSPSAAASAITNSGINGWRFWECKRPGDPGWMLIYNLR